MIDMHVYNVYTDVWNSFKRNKPNDSQVGLSHGCTLHVFIKQPASYDSQSSDFIKKPYLLL